MVDIVLVGAGGHCKSCIDVIEQTGMYKIVGLVDQPDMIGQSVLNYEIRWSDNDIPDLIKKYKNFVITIGQIKSAELRVKLYQLLKKNGANLPVIISPAAYVSRHSTIGEGTIVFHNAVINAQTQIGKNCIINTRAIIEHDVSIGDFCHISTGAIVNGGVMIMDNVFYGSGSVSKEGIVIHNNTIIGGNSYISKNINEPGTYVGSPVIKVK